MKDSWGLPSPAPALALTHSALSICVPGTQGRRPRNAQAPVTKSRPVSASYAMPLSTSAAARGCCCPFARAAATSASPAATARARRFPVRSQPTTAPLAGSTCILGREGGQARVDCGRVRQRHGRHAPCPPQQRLAMPPPARCSQSARCCPRSAPPPTPARSATAQACRRLRVTGGGGEGRGGGACAYISASSQQWRGSRGGAAARSDSGAAHGRAQPAPVTVTCRTVCMVAGSTQVSTSLESPTMRWVPSDVTPHPSLSGVAVSCGAARQCAGCDGRMAGGQGCRRRPSMPEGGIPKPQVPPSPHLGILKIICCIAPGLAAHPYHLVQPARHAQLDQNTLVWRGSHGSGVAASSMWQQPLRCSRARRRARQRRAPVSVPRHALAKVGLGQRPAAQHFAGGQVDLAHRGAAVEPRGLPENVSVKREG